VNKRVVLDMVKLGTGIYKHGWLYEKRPVCTYDPRTGKRVKQTKVRSQPFVDQVRLPDFVLPSYSYSIQPDDQGGAPWVAERLRTTVSRLEQWAISSEPQLPNLDPEAVKLVKNFTEMGQTPYQEKIKSLEYDKVPQPSGDDWKKSIEPG